MIERIRKEEPRIHAYITTPDDALSRARDIDAKVRSGKPVGRLCGLTVAVKDNICVNGLKTTCASRILEDFVPPYDATVVERLQREDALIVGKSNLDEFAMGSSTEFSHFGATRNPVDTKRVPGGSSGGSAAAVRAGEADLALGSDTGGSIRCPASFCGVVGLKPTYGRVSRYGLIAYANSLEQIGPIAGNVQDCALLFSAIAGYDSRDSTSTNIETKDYASELAGGVSGLKVGVPKEFFGEGNQPGVTKSVWKAIEKLESLGATYREIPLKSLEFALASYYIIAMSEASSNLARFDGLRYGYRAPDQSQDWATAYSKTRRAGFGPEVRRRIILGTYALSAGYYEEYYLKALKVRTLIRRDFARALKEFNVLVGPTMPLVAFKIGEKVKDPLQMYLTDIDTVPANLAGLPAISVPCGEHQGLPVGMQIIGPPFQEAEILRVAHAYENA